jgi:hypothetical protein
LAIKASWVAFPIGVVVVNGFCKLVLGGEGGDAFEDNARDVVVPPGCHATDLVESGVRKTHVKLKR